MMKEINMDEMKSIKLYNSMIEKLDLHEAKLLGNTGSIFIAREDVTPAVFLKAFSLLMLL